MAIPGVSTIFARNSLGLLTAPNDNVFAGIGYSSRGVVGNVYSLSDPNSVMATLGFGPLAEMAAQALAQGAPIFYACPGYYTAGVLGDLVKNRSAAPSVSVTQLMGVPGNPLQSPSTNMGTGLAVFAAASVPVPKTGSTPDSSADYDSIEVDITTAGVPGVAVMTTKIGGVVMQTGVTVPTGDYSVVDAGGNPTGLVLDFSVPIGGQFKVGDKFSAVPTQNDGYNLLVTIDSINSKGVAQFTTSLDGGVNTSGLNSAPLGNNVTSFGATRPSLSLSGTPTVTGAVEIVLTRQGTASGVAAQAGTWPGYLFDQASTTTHLATAKITTPSSGQTFLTTVTITSTGTAAGTATSSAQTTGTGTAAGSITIGSNTYAFASNHFPATFTDIVTGVVVAFDTGSGSLTSGDVFTNAGTLTSDNGSGDNAVGTIAITTANTTATAVLVKFEATGDGTAAGTATSGSAATGTGTATGILTIGGNSWNFDTSGGGSGGGGVPAQFTDSNTGIVVKFYAGAVGNELHSGDVYGDGAGGSRTCYAVAQFQYAINGGSAVTGQTVNSSGQNSTLNAALTCTATFGHTGSDIFTFDSLNSGNTTRYTFNLYALPFVYNVPDVDGSDTGLQISFPFGVYAAGDQFTVACTAPSVGTSDVSTATDELFAEQGISFSMVQVAATPDTFATAINICSALNTKLTTQAAAPINRYVTTLVYGPDKRGDVSGATPTDLADAATGLDLEFVYGITCGTDIIVSVLTSRTDERNMGYTITPRLSGTQISMDVGDRSAPLPNDLRTTTTLDEANAFNTARGMTSITVSGRDGVYCTQGISLASTSSDLRYGVNMRVLYSGGSISRLALEKYVNGKVRTVKGPPNAASTGTIDPASAAAIEADVNGQIQALLVTPGNAQDSFVQVSRTEKVLLTGILPLTVGIQPYGYSRFIVQTVGLVISAQ